MKYIQYVCLLILSFLFHNLSFSQDTLPKFSVRHVGNNRIIIGWVNNYDTVKQIGIQRSHDSLRDYRTILSVADPNAVQNGFADIKAPNDHMFYRLFIVLDKGVFFFTKPQKPVFDTSSFSIFKETVAPPQEKKLNLANRTGFMPSFYVYTNKDGYVFINLPDADRKKYHIKFFEENDEFLFEIKNIKESGLTLDKANFMHAGWFKFELYNDEKLVEKHKFYLEKNF